mgnify:CR=1 FL=1
MSITIYNFKKLRASISSNYKFTSGTDTEVILELLERHGLDCLNKISGIYAFGIWDSKKSELISKIKSEHPYDVPSITWWSVESTKEYYDWVQG